MRQALAIAITLLPGLLLRASHPPAAATTLLVALGSLKTGEDAINLLIGAAIVGVPGNGIRMLRSKTATSKAREQQAEVLSKVGERKREPV